MEEEEEEEWDIASTEDVLFKLQGVSDIPVSNKKLNYKS